MDPVLIIGGGVAGLSCGCYLQMSGYDTEILEMGSVPGGLCVAWDRGPYVFDGCLRWLIGTDRASAFHRMWRELGALDGRPILHDDEIVRVEDGQGRAVSVCSDLGQLAKDLCRLAPEDTRRIRVLMRDAHLCAPLEPPIEKPLEVMTPLERIKTGFSYLRFVPVVSRWKNRSLADYVATYRNPFLREVLLAMAGDARMSSLVLVTLLGWRSRKNAAFVAGGSRAFSRALLDRYTRCGGRVRCGTRVTAVTLENGRATGVQCADGAARRASTVVSCADGRTTLFKLLEGRFLTRKLRQLYAHPDLFPALVQVSLGIRMTFPGVPRAINLPVPVPLRPDDQTLHRRIDVSVFSAESGFCPAGATVMTVRLPTRHEYWSGLRAQGDGGYQAEKDRILGDVKAALDGRFPGLARSVECADVATPATFERFTGNWQASYEGWLPTPRMLRHIMPRVLPGLDRFYMAGHWVQMGGGLPSAALSGRYVAQLMCARDGRDFAPSAS